MPGLSTRDRNQDKPSQSFAKVSQDFSLGQLKLSSILRSRQRFGLSEAVFFCHKIIPARQIRKAACLRYQQSCERHFSLDISGLPGFLGSCCIGTPWIHENVLEFPVDFMKFPDEKLRFLPIFGGFPQSPAPLPNWQTIIHGCALPDAKNIFH